MSTTWVKHRRASRLAHLDIESTLQWPRYRYQIRSNRLRATGLECLHLSAGTRPVVFTGDLAVTRGLRTIIFPAPRGATTQKNRNRATARPSVS